MPANIDDRRLEKKYVVFGGELLDPRTNRTYYVSPTAVIKAYGVNPRLCIIGNPDDLQISQGLLSMRGGWAGKIQLRPQQDPEKYKQLPEQ